MSKRLFSKLIHKSTLEIPKIHCLREQSYYATNDTLYKRIKDTHSWCEKFCKDFCMRSAINDCIKSSTGFCEQNCKDECFYVGKVPTKSKS